MNRTEWFGEDVIAVYKEVYALLEGAVNEVKAAIETPQTHDVSTSSVRVVVVAYGIASSLKESWRTCSLTKPRKIQSCKRQL